jgi:hypothetical protein
MVMLTDFSIFECDDVDEYTETFSDYLKFCFDICCPVTNYFVSPSKLTTPHLKFLRRKKEKAYKAHDSAAVKYFTALILEEIKNLNENLVENMFRSSKPADIWSGLKHLTGQVRIHSNTNVDIEELNSSFIYNVDALQQSYNLTSNNNAEFTPIGIDTVFKLLCEIKRNSSAGPDGLFPLVLKECAHYIAPTITQIFNLSFANGKLPSSWKSVKITPIPKSNNGAPAVKLRPIASSSILLKVAEKGLIHEIQPILNTSSDPLQFAYKPRRSTLDAIATLCHNIASSIDNGSKQFRCVFLDFSSAFNTIDRRKILNALVQYGASQWCTNWLSDYFSNRLQYTVFNGKTSSSALNCWGVLQGAVLSPLFFNLYTDKLAASPNSILVKYADDFVLGIGVKSPSDQLILRSELEKVSSWSSANNLLLNTEKCCTCIFSANRLLSSISEPLELNGNQLEVQTHVKYLGVTFSSNLTWTNHIDIVYQKCVRLSFYIRRLISACVPRKLLQQFVDGCIIPIILYASPVVFPGLLQKDFTVLKRAIKIIAKPGGLAYNELCTTVINRHFSACARFCDRILGDSNHPLHIPLSSAVPQHRTRTAFNCIYARTELFRRSPLPFLARFLSNKDLEIEKLKQNLLR